MQHIYVKSHVRRIFLFYIFHNTSRGVRTGIFLVPSFDEMQCQTLRSLVVKEVHAPLPQFLTVRLCCVAVLTVSTREFFLLRWYLYGLPL